jgi:hypothetical protein
LIHDLFKPSN